MNDALASLAVAIIGLIALGFVGLEVLFQISCVTLLLQTRRARGLPCSAWALVITFVPVVGGMAYLSYGRHGADGIKTLPRAAAQALRPQG
jgi:hypothetical protein